MTPVSQTGDFGASTFVYYVNYTSANSSSSSGEGFHTFIYSNRTFCDFSFTSRVVAKTDTINMVTFKQYTDVTASLVCGESTQKFISNDLGETTATSLQSHTWTIASTTK